jgi:predicted NBD/HSP70 family sugar kinase
MERTEVRHIAGGVNQHGVRDHNERLVLSMIQRHGSLPASDLARLIGLTPQTISVILRRLDADGLIDKGDPVPSGVGKPKTPITLARDGALSFGVKIGRRTTDVLLLDFHGEIRHEVSRNYRFPDPNEVFAFIHASVAEVCSSLSLEQRSRIAGIGVARPSELWKWHESVGVEATKLEPWRDVDIGRAIAMFTDLPVFIENDATAAARAEHVFGRGREFRDYAYFYIGAFIGGGIILDNSVYEGIHGNAAAFGPLPSVGRDGQMVTLIETASAYLLEERLAAAGHDPDELWTQPQDWVAFEPFVADWIDLAGPALAHAIMTVIAIIDLEAVLVDGAIPRSVLSRLIERIGLEIPKLDASGLIVPSVFPGTTGFQSRAIGGACKPFQSQFFLSTHSRPTAA